MFFFHYHNGTKFLSEKPEKIIIEKKKRNYSNTAKKTIYYAKLHIIVNFKITNNQ